MLMQITTAAFGTQVTGNDVTAVVRVTITWPVSVPAAYQQLSDLTVVSYRPLRELQTAVPAATKRVSGRAAAAADIELAGVLDRTDETKTIAWLMGQFQSDSPLYRSDALGLPVTVEMGVLTGNAGFTTAGYEGVEFVTVFTGFIDDYDVDMTDGTVRISCLDGRRKLISAPVLPPVVDYNPYSTGLIQPGLTSQYPMAALLRNSGIYTSPPPRPNGMLFASMHGSAWPEDVHGGSVTACSWLFARDFNGYVWDTGIFSQQVPNQSLIQATNLPPVQLSNGGTFFVEYWQKNLGLTGLGAHVDVLGTSGNTLVFDTRLNSPTTVQPKVVFTRGGVPTTVTCPTIYSSLVWHYFSVFVEFPNTTQMRVTFYIDGTAGSVTTTTVPTVTLPYDPAPSLSIGSVGAIEALQCTVEPNPAAYGFNSGFVPTAYLGASLNNLTALPDVSGQDSWQVIQDLADAEQGTAGFDEQGVFRFFNRKSQPNTAVRAITADADIHSMTISTDQASVVNHITCPVNRLQLSAPIWIWSASETIMVKALSSYTQIITTATAVTGVPLKDVGEAPTGGGTVGTTNWRACKTSDGTGARVSTGVSIRCVQTAPNQVTMTIQNVNPFNIYMVSPTTGFPATSIGNPTVNIGGQTVSNASTVPDTTTTTGTGLLADSQYPPASQGGAVSSPRGEILLAMSSNPWRQKIASVQTLTDDLLSDLHAARPQLNGLVITADPRLQLGDRITIVDPDGSGIDGEDAIITRLQFAEDWTMSIDARIIHAPGSWRLGIPGFSELGITTYLA